MGPGLVALTKMILNTLGTSLPETDDLRVLPGGDELAAFLTECNGFYAFGDALHVFPSGTARLGEITLEEWNDEGLWREAYPDYTALDPESKYHDPKASADNPRWVMVDVKFKQKFDKVLTLEFLRTVDELSDMVLLRKGSRLSIQPVTREQWMLVLDLLGE